MSQTTTDPRSAEMKREMAEHFDSFEYEYRNGEDTAAEVVFENENYIVVADHTGHELNEWADDFNLDRSALSAWMHKKARTLCDHSWSVSDPVVFQKNGN